MSQFQNKDFLGRKILIIGIGFYDYESCIVGRLKERGASIFYFQDRPEKIRGGLLSRCKAYRTRAIRHHENAILAEARAEDFDQVLIIKGIDLDISFIKSLRETLPNSEFILYQWDSLARLDGIEQRLHFFDRVFSFDRIDALSRPEMIFRPLFFRENSISKDHPIQDIDLAFVGWLHSDRLESVRRMQSEANAMGLRIFVYIYTGWWTWLKLFIRGEARQVHTQTLPYVELLKIIGRSKCIYDLPHALQTGLTMRAIETLGMQKKLLTSSLDIVNYDFYSADNVSLVGMNEVWLNKDFIFNAPSPVDSKILQKYTLDAWLDDVLLTSLRK